ncbi:MFS transporter [Lactococcus hircilactis]|uniref:MFS transporter n=1 Tax=Lactococcus hircilactis TaxID=1494462 RepID=A0A7X2D0R3_9LACT|nr:MFS transporter [Lactococcus hircilactis]MQW38722.1 MFS transporter [Lactococcus hircilactis]
MTQSKMTQPNELSFGKQVASIYAPTMIYETGIGAVTPVIPLMALELHASPAIAAFIVALLGIGQVVGDIPAGYLATKLGDRKAMLYGAVVTLILLVTCAFTPNWVIFALSIFILGMVNALFVLARQAYLTEVTPPLRRSLSLSILGGMTRIGSLIGPFVGGAIMSIFAISVAGKREDWLPGAFWAAVVLTCITFIVVYAVPEIEVPKTVKKVKQVTVKTSYILRKNLKMFATLGIAIVLVGAVRQTSNTALPLWAAHIGLNASMTSYIYGLSGLLDALLFYPAGKMMDKYGRLWVAIPSMLILGGSILFIPLTHGIWSMAIVSLIMGLGNSIGAGMIMTISADMAPENYRAQFLAMCRLFGDTGAAAGPLLIAAGAGIGFLSGGIWLLGGCGLLSALIMGLTLEKYSIHANQRTRLRHGMTKQGHPIQ